MFKFSSKGLCIKAYHSGIKANFPLPEAYEILNYFFMQWCFRLFFPKYCRRGVSSNTSDSTVFTTNFDRQKSLSLECWTTLFQTAISSVWDQNNSLPLSENHRKSQEWVSEGNTIDTPLQIIPLLFEIWNFWKFFIKEFLNKKFR